MKTTDYKGIDYSLGQSNRDMKTGIRFGVISFHEVLQTWCDASEPHYVLSCPECGQEINEDNPMERCSCDYEIKEGDFDMIEPSSHYIDDDKYTAEQSFDDVDIFIIKSPYYTFAQFCSPCAPGACYLMNPLTEPCESNKCYCFGHDWFDSEKAPYPVYSVETGKRV